MTREQAKRYHLHEILGPERCASTDASTLGLAPGEWPRELTTSQERPPEPEPAMTQPTDLYRTRREAMNVARLLAEKVPGIYVHETTVLVEGRRKLRYQVSQESDVTLRIPGQEG